MCFWHGDAEWFASVQEAASSPAEKDTLCFECRRTIKVGEMVHHIYQQEHEYCGACESGWCDCPEDECCKCDEPDIGETYKYRCCHDCHLFLQAVEDAEVEAGCRQHESRPSLEGMMEEIRDGDRDEAKRYWKKAAKKYPELVKSGYLGWLWRKIFP